MFETDGKIEFIDSFDVSVLSRVMLLIYCHGDAILYPAIPY